MEQPSRNKEAVLKMYEEVFNGHDLGRLSDYMQEDYIQHNPRVPAGLSGFADFFRAHFAKFPDFHIEIKHVAAEGDLVMLHTHATTLPGEAGAAVADIYRLEDGKVAEHWDVIQPVPSGSVNGNGMF